MPTVSVVIPAHEAERYLGEAIESVLAQSLAVSQIVVVDDGSADGTAAVAGRYKEVTLLREPHRGIGATLNRGVEAAAGEYLAFLDADDVWSPSKLERQVAVFAREPSAGLVFGWVRQFISPDVGTALAGRVVCPPEPQPSRLIGSLLIRRADFDRVGSFRSDWRVGQFVDWCTRARELGLREVMPPDVVLLRRLHGANIGLREPAARIDFVRAARASLERRRQRR